ncbi:UvrD-helicase domain-containing protein [uncultured Fusobacterium sp.]|uniref:ATP-dependent helicase n=1 Tax=uncultured Fusobacterium sp. TaxID=159267 RepID=UPI0025F76A4A|nr:UvrD-helicase domain-containing protein [uncultured Fusobacterium sp.]
MSILDKLNERQREAAEKIEGALLILAGAGSGKTRTITYRIAHMVKEVGISPYKILAVTFTNKAAKEMKERVEDLVGEEAKRVMISTFHSFGLRLLRVYGDRLGYNSNFTIYDTDDQKRVVKNIMKDLVIKNKSLKESLVVSIISKLKEDEISPDEYENTEKYNENGKIIAEIYRRYNSVLKSNNAMDFSDILVNTNRILEIPDVLNKVQDKFQYIMVDEYQDTNNIQYKIVNKIAKKYGNICVVGDENQSIYGFRGANIQNILNFEKDYPDATVVKLEENYRSTSVILDAANAVIKNNSSARDKKLWTKKSVGEKITLESCSDGREEASYVVGEIIRGKAKGNKYRDFTILYRTNAQSRMFEEKLLRENIPYKIFGGTQFYQRAEIKDVVAYLSVINNLEDNLNLTRILNVPKRKIGDKTLEKISDFAKENGLSLFKTLGRVEEISGLSANLKITILNFYKMMMEFIELSEGAGVSELFDTIVKEINYNDYLIANYEDYETRKENIEELKNSIVELEKVVENLTLREYLENISLISATDNLEEEKDYVKLMTIHNSKGLEFPIVFIVGMEEGLFPGSRAEFDSNELEEERRLCYVAITRAEEKLYMTYANSRIMYGNEDWSREASRFIDEIPKELIESNISRVVSYKPNNEKGSFITERAFKKMITIEDLNKTAKNFPYSVGEKVMHKKFGLGVVKAVNDKKVEINFVDGKREIAMAVAEKFLTKC